MDWHTCCANVHLYPFVKSLGQLVQSGFSFFWGPNHEPALVPSTVGFDVVCDVSQCIVADRIDHCVPIFKEEVSFVHGVPAATVGDPEPASEAVGSSVPVTPIDLAHKRRAEHTCSQATCAWTDVVGTAVSIWSHVPSVFQRPSPLISFATVPCSINICTTSTHYNSANIGRHVDASKTFSIDLICHCSMFHQHLHNIHALQFCQHWQTC